MRMFALFMQSGQGGSAQAGVAPIQGTPPIEAVPLPPPPPDVIHTMPPPDLHVISAEEIQRIVESSFAQGQFPFGPGGPFQIPGELVGLVVGSLTMILLMIVGYPIARALARRIDRQTLARTDAPLPSAEVVARLERIEHAVETMAVEIERISEGQRFTNRLFSEQARELGAARSSPAGGQR